jgi:hypothetical protein
MASNDPPRDRGKADRSEISLRYRTKLGITFQSKHLAKYALSRCLKSGRRGPAKRAPEPGGACCTSTTLRSFCFRSKERARIQPEAGSTLGCAHRRWGRPHGRKFASALMRSRVHNRTRDRGGEPIRLTEGSIALGPSRTGGGALSNPPHHCPVSRGDGRQFIQRAARRSSRAAGYCFPFARSFARSSSRRTSELVNPRSIKTSSNA